MQCIVTATRAANLSARIDKGVADRLAARGNRGPVNKSRLAERYIDEGMRMDDHPGIVFRDGPTGRRAALAAGPDVWEVIAVARNVDERGEAAVSQAAVWLNLSVAEVRTAVRYYSEFPNEIDERIRRHRDESEAAEAAWKRERAALG